MYFSIHDVAHDCSLLDMEPPGLGTHFSKQFSCSFYPGKLSSADLQATGAHCSPEAHLDENARIGDVGLAEDLLHDSILDLLRVHGFGYAPEFGGVV